MSWAKIIRGPRLNGGVKEVFSEEAKAYGKLLGVGPEGRGHGAAQRAL